MAIYLDMITLIAETQKADESGDLSAKETAREVYATPRTVTMREAYEGAAHGLRPELSFRLADYLDYDDERTVEYEGRRYRVIRVGQKHEDKSLDLICERIVNVAEVNGDV